MEGRSSAEQMRGKRRGRRRRCAESSDKCVDTNVIAAVERRARLDGNIRSSGADNMSLCRSESADEMRLVSADVISRRIRIENKNGNQVCGSKRTSLSARSDCLSGSTDEEYEYGIRIEIGRRRRSSSVGSESLMQRQRKKTRRRMARRMRVMTLLQAVVFGSAAVCMLFGSVSGSVVDVEEPAAGLVANGATDSIVDKVPRFAALVAQATRSSATGLSPHLHHQSAGNLAAPITRTVNPGDRVNIPCALANAGGSIQFAKDEQPIVLDAGCAHCQLDISNDGQASLTINRVSRQDSGQWQCWRLDSSGKVKQKIPILRLEVVDSPEIPILIVNDRELLGSSSNAATSGVNSQSGGANSLADTTVTVRENEPVTFKCLIRGATTPVDYVHWMLDSSQNVTHLSQLIMEYSAQENNYLTQSLLKLNATKSMNLKSVSCVSKHSLWLTPNTVTAFLNVLYEPSFTISREPGFGVPVSEGMSVTLKCEVDSNPPSAPIWIKDAETSNSSSTGNSMSSSTTTTTAASVQQAEPIVLERQEDGAVVFAPALRSDSGWYRCKTENKHGTFSSYGYYLNVRPSTGVSTADNLIGSQQQQQQQQQQPSHQRHAPGGSSLASQPPPMAQHPSRYMAPNQPAARVLGPATSTPANNIVNNDQPIVPQSQQASPQVMQSSSASLCKSGGGSRVDGSPEIDRPVSTVSAILGRPLVLPLRFCCNPAPTRVFWIHRHLALIPGRIFGPYTTRDIYTTYNSFYCYESTFEIDSVKPEDIGTVYVFVSNEKGHSGAQIQIQLAKPIATDQTTMSTFGSRFPLLAGSSAESLGVATQTIGYFALLTASLSIVLLTQQLTQNRNRLCFEPNR